MHGGSTKTSIRLLSTLVALRKCLSIRLLTCLDSLQGEVLPSELPKILLARMRLWRWEQSCRCHWIEVSDDIPTPEQLEHWCGALVTVISDIAVAINELERQLDKSGVSVVAHVHGAQPKAQLEVPGNLTSSMYRCASSGSPVYTNVL